jgi:hypothetical protein
MSKKQLETVETIDSKALETTRGGEAAGGIRPPQPPTGPTSPFPRPGGPGGGRPCLACGLG